MKEREELSTKPPAGINLQEAATGDSMNRYDRCNMHFVFLISRDMLGGWSKLMGLMVSLSPRAINIPCSYFIRYIICW